VTYILFIPEFFHNRFFKISRTGFPKQDLYNKFSEQDSWNRIFN